MWLVVGLGNPGDKYLMTRHNIGFMAVDAFLVTSHLPPWKSEKKAKTYHLQMNDEKIILCQPQTYMNLSGDSVAGLADFYKIPVENIIVIHDDIDQDFGTVKIQSKRGHGGHNAIRDISQKLGSNEYIRIKLGVGRPPHPKMDVAAYVLQKFSPEEQNQLPDFLNTTGDIIESLVLDGMTTAANKFTGKKFVQ